MIRSKRIGIAHATLAIFALAILIQSARVQLAQGKAWRARAERQQTTERTVPAPRGDILDATRHVLAQSREMVRLEIAPREVTEARTPRTATSQSPFASSRRRRDHRAGARPIGQIPDGAESVPRGGRRPGNGAARCPFV